MDKHIKTKSVNFVQSMSALRQPKRILDSQSQSNIRALLKQGVSRKAICSMYSLTYNDLKEFK